MKTKQQSLLILATLIAIFFIPAIVSQLLYHYRQLFHFNTVNHGTLFNPPLHAPVLGLALPNTGQWRVIDIPTLCRDEVTEKTAFALHQLKKSLVNDSIRVATYYATATACQLLHPPPDVTNIVLVRPALASHQAFNDKFNIHGKIYLVDPEDRVFMYYPENIDPLYIYQDLKRVLEVSHIG